MCDFAYLKNQDLYEDKIQENQELLDKDDRFKATYFSMIQRYYILFESICKYYKDLQQTLEEVD